MLVSGEGTNLQAILDATKNPSYPAVVKVVVSNKENVGALRRAEKAGVKTAVVDHRKYAQRGEFEKELIRVLEEAGVEWVVLAGFMRVLSPVFVGHYRGRIVNIHPALLPAFPGVDAIRQAWEAGAKETGVTVHFVDEGTDTGPVILQERVAVSPEETLEILEKKIHAVEHQIYPEAIRSVIQKGGV